MRRRQADAAPEVPDWCRFECDGGFVMAHWAWPDDSGPDWFREHVARGRGTSARHRFLVEHPVIAELLFNQLKDRARVKLRG